MRKKLFRYFILIALVPGFEALTASWVSQDDLDDQLAEQEARLEEIKEELELKQEELETKQEELESKINDLEWDQILK